MVLFFSSYIYISKDMIINGYVVVIDYPGQCFDENGEVLF